MIAEEYLAQLPEWPQVCEPYQKWLQFMEEKSVFFPGGQSNPHKSPL